MKFIPSAQIYISPLPLPLHTPSFTCILQIPRPLLTPLHPLLQPPQIPRAKPTLKGLRISRQTRRDSITLQCIQNWLILLVLRRIDMERRENPDKRSIKLAICEMGPSAHARSGTVGVVRCPGSFGVLEIAFYGEFFGLFEVNWVEVGCPCVL